MQYNQLYKYKIQINKSRKIFASVQNYPIFIWSFENSKNVILLMG
jgi:hypothetical protein